MSFPRKTFLKEKFSSAEGARSRTLYHCMPVAPQGDEIRTSDKYGMTIPEHIRSALGLTPHDEYFRGGTPLVFASAYMGKALAFGLQAGEKIFNMSIEGTEAELVLAVNRDAIMSRVRDVTLFSFADEGFMDLAPETRQSVSPKPVPFGRTQAVLHARSAEDLMRAGLQIFTLKENFSQAHDDPSLADVINGETFLRSAGEFVKSGRLVWENQSRGINPHPILAEKINLRAGKPVITPPAVP